MLTPPHVRLTHSGFLWLFCASVHRLQRFDPEATSTRSHPARPRSLTPDSTPAHRPPTAPPAERIPTPDRPAADRSDRWKTTAPR